MRSTFLRADPLQVRFQRWDINDSIADV